VEEGCIAGHPEGNNHLHKKTSFLRKIWGDSNVCYCNQEIMFSRQKVGYGCFIEALTGYEENKKAGCAKTSGAALGGFFQWQLRRQFRQ